MSTRIEDYIKTITTFEFKAYNMNMSDYLYDATPEQCMNHVWKKYPSAHFSKMTEFQLSQHSLKHIDPKLFKETINKYAEGHDDGFGGYSKKELTEIKEFKSKHNIE